MERRLEEDKEALNREQAEVERQLKEDKDAVSRLGLAGPNPQLLFNLKIKVAPSPEPDQNPEL